MRERSVWRSLVAMVLIVTATVFGGCLGTVRRDQVAEGIALAPRTVIDLPMQESRPYWLLRSQPGWLGAHEAQFGGGADDPGVATVRAARFRDVESATNAFAHLTADYIHLLLRDRVKSTLSPFPYPAPLPGDEAAVMAYDVRLPPEVPPDVTIIGQLTAIRAGRVVLFIESIGIPPQQLVSAIAAATSAAYRVSGPRG